MNNKYSLSEMFSNMYALLLTKIFFKDARLIRRPVYIRGKKSLLFEKGLTLGHGCRFDMLGDNGTLKIGKNCEMGDYTHIVAHKSVVIGENVLIASKVFISDVDHGMYKGEHMDSPKTIPKDRKLYFSPVKIGNNVWIGENAVILPGSEIGNGCIIGANAVVKGCYEDNCIIVGAPARVIKKWDEKAEIWRIN